MPSSLSRIITKGLATFNGGSRRDRMARLAASTNFLVRFLQIGISLLLMRMMIPALGQSGYGLWVMITGITALAASADLGIGNSILNFVSYAYSEGNWEKIGKIITNGLVALFIISAALLLILLGTYKFLDLENRMFSSIPEPARGQVGTATLAFIISIILSIPLSLFEKFLQGIQKSHHAFLWRGGITIAVSGILLIMILCGASLPLLVHAQALLPLMFLICMCWAVARQYKDRMNISFGKIERASLTTILADGWLFCLLQIAVSLGVMSDNYVVGYALGAEAVTQLAVPVKLFALSGMVIGALVSPLWAAYAEAAASGDEIWIRANLAKMTKIVVIFLSTYTVGAVIFGKWACSILSGGNTSVSHLLLLLLGMNATMSSMVNLYAYYMNARRLLKYQIVFGLAARSLNILVSLVLVRRFGVEGAILSTLLVETALLLFPFIRITYHDLRKIRHSVSVVESPH